MIIDFPHLLVVRVMLLLQPFVPALTPSFNAQFNARFDIYAPLTFDSTGLLSVDVSWNLHRLASPCLWSECLCKVWWSLKGVLIRLSDRDFAHFSCNWSHRLWFSRGRSLCLREYFGLLHGKLTVVLIQVDLDRFGLSGDVTKLELLDLSLNGFIAPFHVYFLFLCLVVG